MKSVEERVEMYESRLLYIGKMLELCNNSLVLHKSAEGYIVKDIEYLIMERESCMRKLMKLREKE
jgi:hypothetical protein